MNGPSPVSVPGDVVVYGDDFAVQDRVFVTLVDAVRQHDAAVVVDDHRGERLSPILFCEIDRQFHPSFMNLDRHD
jgi:hypothetical protein